MFNLGSLGSLFVSLSVDTAKFEGDMGKAAHSAQRSGRQIEAAFSAIGPTVAASAAAAAGAMALLIKNTIDLGDQLSKTSSRTGFSVERLSELQYAAQLADVNVGQLQTSLGMFNKALAEAQNPTSKQAELFRALGVDINQGAQSAFDQFLKSVEQLPKHETKVAAMRIAFGRTGDALLQMAGSLDQATESARKLGLVMSADMARQSETFKDNLTIIAKQSEAFGISVTGKLIGGLSTLSTRMVAAAESGQAFTGWLREMVFLATALAEKLSLLPRGVGQGIFDALDPAQQGAMGGPAKGLIRRPGGVVAPPAPNAEATACAVSGGRWVNGKCIRPGGSKKSDGNLVGEQWAEDMEEWNRIMSEAAAATVQFNQRMGQNAYWENMGVPGVNSQEDLKRYLEALDSLQEIQDNQARVVAGFDEMGNAIGSVERATTDWGFTFNSALEDMILRGGKLSDVVKSLGDDIARMIIRSAITEPLGKGISTAMAPISKGVGDFFSGLFKAGGGPVTGGNPYIVGERGPELFVPGASGTIVPNHAMAGGTNIHVTLNVGSLDPRTAAHVILANESTIKGMFRKAAKWRGEA